MKTAKRILCLLFVTIIMVLMICPVVFATDSSPGTPTESQNEFLSWGYLATMGGAVAATTIIVQFLKVPIDKVWKIPTRFIVYLIALIIMIVAECITQGGISIDKAGLIAVNAILVTTAAMGSYEITFKKFEPG